MGARARGQVESSVRVTGEGCEGQVQCDIKLSSVSTQSLSLSLTRSLTPPLTPPLTRTRTLTLTPPLTPPLTLTLTPTQLEGVCKGLGLG